MPIGVAVHLAYERHHLPLKMLTLLAERPLQSQV